MTDGPTNPTPTPPPGGMPGAPVSLIDRAKNILMSPSTEWPRIAAEPSSIQQIYTSYAMILAALGPIAGLIGAFLLMPRVPGASLPLAFLLGTLVLSYLVSLALLYVMALVLEALAPNFGGTKDRVGAFKVIAYASTAAWVVAILSIVPFLGLLVYLAYIWVAFLIYMGLGPVLRVPQDKAIVLTLVLVAIYVVLMFVLAAIVGAILFSMFMTAAVNPLY